MGDKCVTVKNEYISGFLEATVLSEVLKVLNIGHSLIGGANYSRVYRLLLTIRFVQKWVRLNGITQSPFTEARVLPLSGLWKKPCSGGGGARLCNTLYPNKHTWMLSSLKCMSL